MSIRRCLTYAPHDGNGDTLGKCRVCGNTDVGDSATICEACDYCEGVA